ncbi:MAG: glycosyltransferase, partial [Bacteroidetes bacterium]|nr:glycosyltransferase [Bacteroidota bacterium]
MKIMIHTFLVLLLGLFQATACDSNGPSDPDIRGGWDGSVFVPNSPFPVFMHFKLNIENDSISGIGFYELDLDGIFQRDSIEIRGIFRRTEITISGSFEYPTVIFEITGEDGRDDLFVGEIDDKDKQGFLGNAYALLFPIEWPEPFGLVMIEAMACGTPVVAYRRGSTPEIIDHGVTGFLVDDLDSAGSGVLTFRGEWGDGGYGLYSFIKGKTALIAGTNTEIPGGAGIFAKLGGLVPLGGGGFAFSGAGADKQAG